MIMQVVQSIEILLVTCIVRWRRTWIWKSKILSDINGRDVFTQEGVSTNTFRDLKDKILTWIHTRPVHIRLLNKELWICETIIVKIQSYTLAGFGKLIGTGDTKSSLSILSLLMPGFNLFHPSS